MTFGSTFNCSIISVTTALVYRSFIQGRVQISVELKAQKLGEEIAKEQVALDELTKVRLNVFPPPSYWFLTLALLPNTPHPRMLHYSYFPYVSTFLMFPIALLPRISSPYPPQRRPLQQTGLPQTTNARKANKTCKML